jgi:hypothetical protein
MISKLTKLTQERSALDLQRFSNQSIKWYQKKIEQLRNPSTIFSQISKEESRHREKFSLGRLYLFSYDPKTKENLPYYDIFPLVLVLEKDGNSFLGLNLHYLPLKYRVVFLDKLLDLAQLDTNGDIKRVQVTYDILSASKRFKEFRPCIKRYLLDHVKSKILAVQPDEWETAVFMPFQHFKKAPARKVWEDSVQEIGKN